MSRDLKFCNPNRETQASVDLKTRVVEMIGLSFHVFEREAG